MENSKSRCLNKSLKTNEHVKNHIQNMKIITEISSSFTQFSILKQMSYLLVMIELMAFE